MPSTPLWLTEADVVRLLDVDGAIAAVAEVLRDQSSGGAHNMAKTHAAWGDGATLHAVGGVWERAATVGAKVWAHTPGGASPLVVLYDAACGDLLAVVEAFAMGQLRTAAVSGVATDALAAPDADTLGIVGTGKQAFPQVAAVVAVRPIRRVIVSGRSAEPAERLVTRIEADLGVTAETGSVADVAACGVITLVTRATEPFLSAAAPAPGSHVNAVGAIVPSRAEFEPELLQRARLVVTDDAVQARRLSRELQLFYGDDESRWSQLHRLADVLGSPVASAGGDVTVFKAMGIGLLDVAVGTTVLHAARVRGLGRPMPARDKAEPRWRSRRPAR